jgi:hypothetical protein
VPTVSLELWLFAVVMEVIVISTFFGGTFMAYRVGRRQSAAATAPGHTTMGGVPHQARVLSPPAEVEDRTSAAA